MSKTVIIYKSKYFSTKRYAGWLSIKTGADLYELSDIRILDLKKYQNIVFGGYIEEGYIKGIEFIKKNYDKIKDKKIIVFSVGLGLYNRKEIMDLNFKPKDKFKEVEYFELLGDFNYTDLDFKDKFKLIYGSSRISSNLLDHKVSIINSKKDNLKEILNILVSENI